MTAAVPKLLWLLGWMKSGEGGWDWGKEQQTEEPWHLAGAGVGDGICRQVGGAGPVGCSLPSEESHEVQASILSGDMVLRA